MVIKKQTKDDVVYRGINLYESELYIIINSLQKTKVEGSNEIIKYLKKIIKE